MNAPKVITEAARRYLNNLDAELREAQLSRDMTQKNLERNIARVNEYDSIIKQFQAEQEEIRAWLEEQEKEGGEQE